MPCQGGRFATHVVVVTPAGGAMAGVEAFGCLFKRSHYDGRGREGVYGALQASHIGYARGTEMRHLAACVHAGIGASCTRNGCVFFEYDGQCLLQRRLDRWRPVLALPSTKGTAVIFNYKAMDHRHDSEFLQGSFISVILCGKPRRRMR